MKEIGEMEWQKDKATSITQTAMCTQENFIKIELMGSEFTYIKTGRRMKDSGKMICKMVQERKSLRMVRNMMVCLRMERNGVKELTNGQMILCILATGSTTISKEMESIDGPTAEFTMDNGKKTNYTAKVFIPGLMAENMKENTKMIRNMVLAHTIGQTEKHTKDNGSTASNMARLDSLTQKVEVS